MSFGRPQESTRALPTMPTGTEIAAYSTYLQAQQAVDYLAEQHFAVEQLTILGTDLRSVERVTGRLSYGRVAVAGAMSGAWFGLFVGLLLSLFGGAGVADGIMVIAIALGAGFGLLFSVLSYTFTRGRRDFTSQSQTVAGRYAVLCSGAEAAFEARRLLLNSPVGIGDPVPNPTPGIPGPGPLAAPQLGSVSAVPFQPQAGEIPQQTTPIEQPPTVVIVEQPGFPAPPPPPPTYPQPVSALDPTAAGQSSVPQVVASGVEPIVAGNPPGTATAAAKEPDSRWTLPNGMPRYGALASEVEVQAAVARAAQTGPTGSLGQGVVVEPAALPQSPTPQQNAPADPNRTTPPQ